MADMLPGKMASELKHMANNLMTVRLFKEESETETRIVCKTIKKCELTT